MSSGFFGYFTPRKQRDGDFPIRTTTASSIRAPDAAMGPSPAAAGNTIDVSSPSPVVDATISHFRSNKKPRRQSREIRSKQATPTKVEPSDESKLHKTPTRPKMSAKRSKPAAAQPEAQDAADTSSQEDGQFKFNGILDHRWKDDHISLQVDWEGYSPSWVREATIQEDSPQALWTYWKKQGGRPPNEEDPDLFIIFAIHKVKNGGKNLLVEWLGYKEKSWEPRETVEEAAPELLEEFLEKRTLSGRGPETEEGAVTTWDIYPGNWDYRSICESVQ